MMWLMALGKASFGWRHAWSDLNSETLSDKMQATWYLVDQANGNCSRPKG